MKLLIITQAVDKNNPVLGFFHRWIEELAKNFESIVVICLEKGEYNLPSNIKVFSLGKETGASKIKRLFNFYKYIWREHKNYDAVFVHMNQEYVLLGWKTWWFFGKKIYMWRNHGIGNWLTDLSAFFCKKVFCTSRFSYTVKYKKTVIMPVGIDTDFFKPIESVSRKLHSILFLARMAPAKKPDVLLEVLKILKEKGIDFTASFYGDPSSKDLEYYQSLKDKTKSYGLSSCVSFYPGVPNDKTPEIYSAHDIFVNLSSSGMYDKTIFEAMACGCLVLVSNVNLKNNIDDQFIFADGNKEELLQKLLALFSIQNHEAEDLKMKLRSFAEGHSLKLLAENISSEIIV